MSRFHGIAAQSIESLFRVFAVQALIRFEDGSEITADVIPRFPDEITNILDTRVHSATRMFDLKKADIPIIKVIESITVNGRVYKTQGEPIVDQHDLSLKVEAHEIESSP
jgi:hypothetical protein